MNKVSNKVKKSLVAIVLLANVITPIAAFAGVYHGNIKAGISFLNNAYYRLSIARQQGMFDGYRIAAMKATSTALDAAYAADSVDPKN